MITGDDITKQEPESIPWRDRTWRLLRRTDQDGKEIGVLFLQMNDDGSATQWRATIHGPIGQTGTLSTKASELCEEVTFKADHDKFEAFITQLEQSNRLATTIATAMQNGKDKQP